MNYSKLIDAFKSAENSKVESGMERLFSKHCATGRLSIKNKNFIQSVGRRYLVKTAGHNAS